MTSWVSTEILSQESPSQRASVIENFIRIATYCHQHNDMHCSLNITIALGSACIKSLKQTWEEVDKKYKRQLEKLRDWTDYHGRCKKMRERLERFVVCLHVYVCVCAIRVCVLLCVIYICCNILYDYKPALSYRTTAEHLLKNE